MITGPLFFPVAYQMYACVAKVYLAAKSVNAFVNAIVGFIFGNIILNSITGTGNKYAKNNSSFQGTSVTD